MNDDQIEARLRSALGSRAASVEPATGADVLPSLHARAAAARRRVARQRVLLSVAAFVVVVAAITGAVALFGADDKGRLATEGPSTTATTAPAPIGDDFAGPAIWPFAGAAPFESPGEAAASFYLDYLAFPALDACGPPEDVVAPNQVVVPLCSTDMSVRVRDDGDAGWVVVGADTDEVELDVTVAPEGGVHLVGSSPEGTTAELRPVGSLEVAASQQQPAGSFDDVLAPGDDPTATGAYVALVRTSSTAAVRSITLAGAAVTTTTPTTQPTTTTSAPTTTTTEEADDGTIGWPGASVGGFADPVAGATAFADQVLGFGDTTAVGPEFPSPTDATVAVTARPGAGAQTVIALHDTGARGWVVTGATSSQGHIDTPAAGAHYDGHISGTATAFEAQIALRILSITGDTLASGTVLAGATGEPGPFDTTLEAPASATGPAMVLVGEGDASGAGDLSWAAIVIVEL